MVQQIRTLILGLLIAFAASCVILAQEDPAKEQASKSDASRLLKKYLSPGKTKGRKALRAKLIALGAAALQEAIGATEFSPIGRAGKRIGFKTRCPDGYDRPYWVYVPKDYDPATAYPLIISLHGGVGGAPASAGEGAISGWQQALDKKWAKGVFLLGPAADCRNTSEDAMWWKPEGQRSVLHMLAEAKGTFNIDDDRVFVTGHSDGGSGVFGFANRNQEAFAGYFPMCGNPLVPHNRGATVWLENFAGAQVYGFNGGKDRLYPAASLLPIYKQANDLGAWLEIKGIDDLTHDIRPVFAKETKTMLDKYVSAWLRDPLPAKIDWTTDKPETGRRAWISIDKLMDLGKANAVKDNAQIKIPGRRVRLGIQLAQGTNTPTVGTVVKGSTAEAMGMKKGDVLTKFDEIEIKAIKDLIDALGKKKPGDKVTIIVTRAGKEITLKGEFFLPQQRRDPELLVGRVRASQKDGVVLIKVRDVATLSLWIAPEMLKEGKLTWSVNGSKPTTVKVAAEAGLILDEFERTRDRKSPWIARIRINVAKALGLKKPTQESDPDEDEF